MTPILFKLVIILAYVFSFIAGYLVALLTSNRYVEYTIDLTKLRDKFDNTKTK